MEAPSGPSGGGSIDDRFDEESFSGRVRLFPLAGVTLLPGIVQPLHIFEERYRSLMEDALADDRLIAMAVLKPGWESEYSGRPPVEETACLGQIVTHHRLDDGRYNLLLAGLRRVRINREVEPINEYRVAEVQVLSEATPPASGAGESDLYRRLVAAVRARTSGPMLEEALGQRLPLTLLTDSVALNLPLHGDVMRELLAEVDATARARRLLEVLGEEGEGGGSYPPSFSVN